jgi:protein gp37
MASRLEAIGQVKYSGLTRVSGRRPKWNGKINLDWDGLEIPKRWRTGKIIFVNSMSDLFHEDVPFDFIKAVFMTMKNTPQHTYQVLTKRAERLESISQELCWPSNVWMGVSVESKDYTSRIDCLRRCGAAIKFLSLEPLLGPIDNVNLDGIDWAIAGGESGPGARAMRAEWVRSIRDQCARKGVAFHFKQWGGVNKKKAGRLLDGRTWDEMPAIASAAREPHDLFA